MGRCRFQLVLIHVPARRQALKRMVAALKPGGWIVVEDFDNLLVDRSFPARDADSAALIKKMVATLNQLASVRGSEFGWGRNLYQRFLEEGLVAAGAEGHLALWRGDSIGAQLDRANFEQIRAEAVGAGLATDQEIDAFLSLLDDPEFVLSSPVMMSAWGKRP